MMSNQQMAPDPTGLIRWLRDFPGPGSVGTNEAADALESLALGLVVAEDKLGRIRDIIDAVEPQSAVGPVGHQIRVIANSPQSTSDWLRERDGHSWSSGCAFGAMHGYSDIHNPYRDAQPVSGNTKDET